MRTCAGLFFKPLLEEMMDPRTLTNAQLIAFTFGVSGATADEAVGQFFPRFGEHFAMDCNSEPLRDRLAAAMEIQRRMAENELPTMSSPAHVKAVIQRMIAHEAFESFWVMFLGIQNKVITTKQMSVGTLTQCSVYPREIVRAALTNNATAVILAHNHPSGNSEPSRADETLTQTIKASLALIDVRVLDHFIVTQTTVRSMAEMGLV
jgi:DNA repair protein RadC